MMRQSLGLKVWALLQKTERGINHFSLTDHVQYQPVAGES